MNRFIIDLFKRVGKFLIQITCRHNYQLDDPDEVFPEPPPGGAIAFARPFTCERCGKKTILGSGWII